MSLSVQVAGKSDIGCVRSNNEDNFGFDQRHGIYIVCDGMGGQAAGEVASKMAVDSVLTYFRQGDAEQSWPAIGAPAEKVSDRANRLGSAIHLANQAIFEAASSNLARQGMGSTIVAVKTEGSFFSLGHVGDSRIYLLRDANIQQMTNDHSLVMEQVRRGMITLAEAHASDMANVIIRALGSDSTVQPDLDDQMALPGDTLLLCSDGLTRHLPDDSLLEIVTRAANLPAACDALIAAARDAGGEDNITCLLLRFETLPWYQQWFGGGRPKWQNSI